MDLMVKVQILLTLEQFQHAVPETLATYIQRETMIIYSIDNIHVSSIVSVGEKPLFCSNGTLIWAFCHKWIRR